MGKWIKRTAAEWEAVFKSQAGSGVSGARYCRDHGVDYKQFLYFRKKLIRKRNPQVLTIAESGITMPVARREGFVPVRVENGCAMRLRFPRGLVVESDGILPPSWIAEAAERWLRMGDESC